MVEALPGDRRVIVYWKDTRHPDPNYYYGPFEYWQEALEFAQRKMERDDPDSDGGESKHIFYEIQRLFAPLSNS